MAPTGPLDNALNLPNGFITEGVVPKMREEKRRRQFVFATHNANVPEILEGGKVAFEMRRLKYGF